MSTITVELGKQELLLFSDILSQAQKGVVTTVYGWGEQHEVMSTAAVGIILTAIIVPPNTA